METKKVNSIINDLNNKGFCIIKNFYSKKKCNFFIKEIEKILKIRIKKRKFVGGKNSIVLYNYFQENLKLAELIYNKKLDNILSKIIDKEYVLNNAVIRNVSNFRIKSKSSKNEVGITRKWHTDSRYVQNYALYPPINYLLITPLEDFYRKNGATKYIPFSHKLLKRKKKQNYKKFKYLEADGGSLIILDINLTHKAGDPSSKSRWAVWNKYSPWFVKPYFQFPSLLKKKRLPKQLQKVLHFNSIPPLNYTIRMETVTKI